jgi:hypothetical protein
MSVVEKSAENSEAEATYRKSTTASCPGRTRGALSSGSTWLQFHRETMSVRTPVRVGMIVEIVSKVIVKGWAGGHNVYSQSVRILKSHFPINVYRRLSIETLSNCCAAPCEL